MATVTLKGNPLQTSGELPAPGAPAPSFTLTTQDLGQASLADFAGKKVVLNIFPSIDTPTCATSVRTFNQKAASADAEVLCVSKDLPFAQKRFCGAEGIDQVTTLSSFRASDFGKDYGVDLIEGPLQGLHARAVVVVGADGKVLHAQLVDEIADEPDYDAAIAALA